MSVFHIKYRPQLISQLDLEDIAKTLSKVLKDLGSMPQSYLFAGPKGSGKTSAARIIARSINCLDRDGIEPCGKCANCNEIISGNSMDIIEIDAASNRGIEDIRTLKEGAYLMPSRLQKKVFIIDEVHMLTKEAFNALLKLIEEPPRHTVFILCTTDPDKIPETVLSRLMRVDFRKGKKIELHNSLKRTIDKEKLKISEEALDIIVSQSDGSFRNVQRTLNEMVLQIGSEISSEQAKTFFEVKFGQYKPESMEEDLVEGDAKVVLQKLEKLAEKRVDFSEFRERLLDYFQKRLLENYGIGETGVKSGLEGGRIGRLINLLIAAGKQEKDVSIGQLPLQLAVVEFLGTATVSAKQVDKEDKDSGGSEKPPIKQTAKEESAGKTVKNNLKSIDIAQVSEQWEKILTAVKPYNHSVEAFLRATKPMTFEEEALVLEVYYPFHKERLEEPRNRKIVETGLTKVFGLNIAFKCVLSKSKKKPLVIKNETPLDKISENLVEGKASAKDIYDVAKDIFG